MRRRYLAQALLVASLGALAATGYAQTNSTTDQTPGSPGQATPSAGAGTTAGTTTGMGTTGAYGTTTGTMRPMTDADIATYEKAGGACNSGPAAQRDQCWSSLYTQYHVHPKCQKLTGNAFVACQRGQVNSDTGGK